MNAHEARAASQEERTRDQLPAALTDNDLHDMNGPEPASTAFQGAAIPTSETVAAVAKGVTAWAAVGISSWHDVAAVLAAVYTALLIIEWVWKRLRRQPIDSGGAR